MAVIAHEPLFDWRNFSLYSPPKPEIPKITELSDLYEPEIYIARTSTPEKSDNWYISISEEEEPRYQPQPNKSEDIFPSLKIKPIITKKKISESKHNLEYFYAEAWRKYNKRNKTKKKYQGEKELGLTGEFYARRNKILYHNAKPVIRDHLSTYTSII